jgi:neutral ceramidase
MCRALSALSKAIRGDRPSARIGGPSTNHNVNSSPIRFYLPMRPILCLLLLAFPGALRASDLQAGVARTNITPQVPFWLSGYAARTNPAVRVNSDLWAKALALQDPPALVSSSLPPTSSACRAKSPPPPPTRSSASSRCLGPTSCSIPRTPTPARHLAQPQSHVRPQCRRSGRRARLCGATHRRSREDVACEALLQLEPARLQYGVGKPPSPSTDANPPPTASASAKTDPARSITTCPCSASTDPQGELRAVLFGYACHNTTLVGNNYEIDGDYAGAAQQALEMAHPGVTALFLMLCGGDQNPSPRGTLQLAEQHGHSLAAAVTATLMATSNRSNLPCRPPTRRSHSSSHRIPARCSRPRHSPIMSSANVAPD